MLTPADTQLTPPATHPVPWPSAGGDKLTGSEWPRPHSAAMASPLTKPATILLLRMPSLRHLWQQKMKAVCLCAR